MPKTLFGGRGVCMVVCMEMLASESSLDVQGFPPGLVSNEVRLASRHHPDCQHVRALECVWGQTVQVVHGVVLWADVGSGVEGCGIWSNGNIMD